MKPVSTKRSEIVQSKKFVQVRTKSSVTTREYSVRAGYKHYVLGPKAPRRYQKQLNPPTPQTRIDEGYSRKNMCVSSRLSPNEIDYGKIASIEAIEGEKKEEDVLHTYISCKNKAKTEQSTNQTLHEQFNPLEKAILRISKEGDSHG